MQIDFHHAVTYVVCRLAGFSHADAQIVACSAQYVDDATNSGVIKFTTGERYVRASSAHKQLDLRSNSSSADNRMVWVPFHFLPGVDEPEQHYPGVSRFVGRMVCRPDSALARRMVEHVTCTPRNAFTLHRLGIALHTYVDTWAHQGFVGLIDDFNQVKSLQIENRHDIDLVTSNQLTGGIRDFIRKVTGLLPVGHASVMTLPDMPFLEWSFVRKNGERVYRNNRADFVQAAVAMFNSARRFLAADPKLPAQTFRAEDLAKIKDLLWDIHLISGEERHAIWLNAIADGAFSFGPVQISYIAKGEGSWKHAALGTAKDSDDGHETFVIGTSFLRSDWKYFHDALQFQRNYVLHELLPEFGLCAA